MNTNKMILYALFASLTAVSSMISIPLPFTPVPINLATLSVFLAGGLLGAKGGAVSQIVYVFIGAIGLPVFSNFSGGLGVLAGPTGGYIIGYVVAAWITGLVIGKLGQSYYKNAFGMLAGLSACYTFGILWFMNVANMGISEALLLTVVPFLIGDGVKIIIGAILVKKLHRFV